jgi:hypothetical protein
VARTQLPANYHLLREIDMRKDKKIAFWLNAIGTIVFLVLGGVGYVFHPITTSFTFNIYHILVLLGGLLVYIIIHELIHAIFMRLYCHGKINFGFHTYAAFAGMKDGYFNKWEYASVAFAPVVLLGLILLALNLWLPVEWFWPIFLIQGQNLAGAVGDYYVIFLLLKTPASTLVNDDGMSMRYYAYDEHRHVYDEDPIDDYPDLQ